MICAQTVEDAERFRQLGAKPERVMMAGNLKFDAQPPQLGEFARTHESAPSGMLSAGRFW